jgi:peptide/nickel transport system permease protein
MKLELRLGLIVTGLLLATALLAPWLAPCSPDVQLLEKRLEGPTAAHWLGLDELGRDVLSRLIYGARISVLVGVVVILLAGAVGVLIGAVAGYLGGLWDDLLMRVCEIFQSFPGILLAIALVAVLGPALPNLIFALAAVGWVGYARVVRAQVMAQKQRTFVEAARAGGVTTPAILVRHILPQIWPTVAVQASLGLAGAILSEAGLSFLGLGVPPPTPSWGSMINAGRSHLLEAPHVATFPGLAVFVSVLCLNFLGDALAERLSPGRDA